MTTEMKKWPEEWVEKKKSERTTKNETDDSGEVG